MAQIISIRRHRGVAEQVSYDVVTRYPDGDVRSSFVSTGAGAGVFVAVEGLPLTRVTDPRRYGPALDEAWVRRFIEDGR